jgi:hypothetical protein
MSLHEYKVAIDTHKKNLPFYSLIMTAMIQADDNNLKKLKTAWPKLYEELEERYHSPGGLLKNEY